MEPPVEAFGGAVLEMIVGIATGVSAAWLSVRQFRAQRQWEQKEEAYREVLEALHHMSSANDVELKAEMDGRQLSPSREEEVHRRWRKGKAVVEKYADVASVLIS